MTTTELEKTAHAFSSDTNLIGPYACITWVFLAFIY